MEIKNKIKKQLEKKGTVNMEFTDVEVDCIFRMTIAEFENIKTRKEDAHLGIVEKFEKAVRKTNSLNRVERLANLFEGKVAKADKTELQNAERFFDAFDCFNSFTNMMKREEIEEQFEVFKNELAEGQ